MSNAPITAQEGELLNLIGEMGNLAWRKYQQRFPNIWVNNQFQREDRSGYPPFISFRFEHENAELIARLKLAIEEFNGAVDWVLGEHKRDPLPGTNRIICPKRFWEINNSTDLTPGISAGKYMAEHEPTFGPVAYEDLLALTAYLRNIFGRTRTPQK
jgi:hypothetical protein